MLISTAVSALSAVGSYMMTPRMPQQDTTNYDLLRQTQAAADAESAEAKARIEEARKREELRQQQLAGQNIKTSEAGADMDGLTVKNVVLGSTKKKDEEEDL